MKKIFIIQLFAIVTLLFGNDTLNVKDVTIIYPEKVIGKDTSEIDFIKDFKVTLYQARNQSHDILYSLTVRELSNKNYEDLKFSKEYLDLMMPQIPQEYDSIHIDTIYSVIYPHTNQVIGTMKYRAVNNGKYAYIVRFIDIYKGHEYHSYGLFIYDPKGSQEVFTKKYKKVTKYLSSLRYN